MPRINITDTDQTRSFVTVDDSYGVYVPGLSVKYSALVNDAQPEGTIAAGLYTFTTSAEFVNIIGETPATCTIDGSVVNDPSYPYAYELLLAGLPIIYDVLPLTDSPTINTIVDAIETSLVADNKKYLVDRGAFDISFITSGGYGTIGPEVNESTEWNISGPMIAIGDDTVRTNDNNRIETGRGDCFAIIDLDKSYDITNGIEGIAQLAQFNSTPDAFCVAPWITVTPSYEVSGRTVLLPGSFAYLRAFANSIRTNSSWFATAGVKRGLVSTSGLSTRVTNAEADALQPDEGFSINAMTYIKPYGYCIWGNRTLRNNSGLVANSFINVRQLVHDIKRNLYSAAKRFMFDPNDDVLWVNFRNQITPLLEKMRTGQGISSYRLIRKSTGKRGQLAAKIVISPIEAVEDFELTVILTDEVTEVLG